MNPLTNEELKLFKRKYSTKKASTVGRIDKNGNAIEFKMSFDEYVSIYQQRGVYPNRPYVLARNNDKGHYEVGNVKVQHNLENICDALGITSEIDKKITNYCIENNYSRQIVKGMIKRGELELFEVEDSV